MDVRRSWNCPPTRETNQTATAHCIEEPKVEQTARLPHYETTQHAERAGDARMWHGQSCDVASSRTVGTLAVGPAGAAPAAGAVRPRRPRVRHHHRQRIAAAAVVLTDNTITTAVTAIRVAATRRRHTALSQPRFAPSGAVAGIRNHTAIVADAIVVVVVSVIVGQRCAHLSR